MTAVQLCEHRAEKVTAVLWLWQGALADTFLDRCCCSVKELRKVGKGATWAPPAEERPPQDGCRRTAESADRCRPDIGGDGPHGCACSEAAAHQGRPQPSHWAFTGCMWQSRSSSCAGSNKMDKASCHSIQQANSARTALTWPSVAARDARECDDEGVTAKGSCGLLASWYVVEQLLPAECRYGAGLCGSEGVAGVAGALAPASANR